MPIKKSINKIEKRYYIDENKRIIKETKVKNVTLSEVISREEIIHLTELVIQIIEMGKDETINQ